MPVDPKTYRAFQDARNVARTGGQDLGEVLDRRQLLLTPQRRHEIEAEAFRELGRRLGKQDPAKLLRFYFDRETGTAAEMFMAMQQWIDTLVRAVVDGRLEEVDDLAEQAQRR